MPKISQIAIDQAVDKGDKLLGSDAGGGTRNYRVEDISKFIKDTNAAGVVGQYPYIYYNSAFGGNSSRPSGSITIDTPNDTFAFADVTTIKFSNKTFGSDNVINEALLALDGKTVAISDNGNQNNFGIYTCTGVTQDPVETNFYNVSLTAVSTNGSLTDGEFYSVLNSVVVETEIVQSDWNATSGDALILNKPTIPTDNSQLTNGAGFITSYTETDTLDSVTSRGNTTSNDINLIGNATGIQLYLKDDPTDANDYAYIKKSGRNVDWLVRAGTTNFKSSASGAFRFWPRDQQVLYVDYDAVRIFTGAFNDYVARFETSTKNSLFYGNVLIGTTTDAGYKLDVNGNIAVRGSVYVPDTSGTLRKAIGPYDSNEIAFYGTRWKNQNSQILTWGETNLQGPNYWSLSAAFGLNIAGSPYAQSTRYQLQLSKTIYNGSSTAGDIDLLRIANTINFPTGPANKYYGIRINPVLTDLGLGEFYAIQSEVGKVVHKGLTNATHADQVYYNSATGELTYGAAASVGSTPTLQEVTDEGNTSSNPIVIGASSLPSTGFDTKLYLQGNGSAVSGRTGFVVKNTSANSAAIFRLLNSNDDFINFQISGPSYTTPSEAGINVKDTVDLGIGAGGNVASGATNKIGFRTGGYAQDYAMTILGNKNVLIGTTTDAGYKLDVNGTARIGNSSYYLTLANGGAAGGILRVGGANYGYAELKSTGLTLNGGHTIAGTGGTQQFVITSNVAPISADDDDYDGAMVFRANNPGAQSHNSWSGYSNAKAFNFIKKNFDGTYTSLLVLHGNNNVGVGVVNPSYKLDVNGTARISESLYLDAEPTATTQTTAVISATDTDSGIAIVPNGTGAITASIPDGTATGGNARGDYALDLQRARSDANQIALAPYSSILSGYSNRVLAPYSIILGGNGNYINGSAGSSYQNKVIVGGNLNQISNSVTRNTFIGGGYANNINGATEGGLIVGGYQNTLSGSSSVISGGRSNTVSSYYSTISGGQGNTASTNSWTTVVGGQNNTSSGAHSVSGGKGNTASGTESVSIGESNVASNRGSVSLGRQNTASGLGSFAVGYGNSATSNYSSVFGLENISSQITTTAIGMRGNAYLFSQFSHSSNRFSVQGDAQASQLVARKSDTLSTGGTTVLCLDGTGTSQLIIPDGTNRAWNVKVETIAVVTSITGTADGVSVGDALMQDDSVLFARVGGTSSIVGTNNTNLIASTSMGDSSITYSAGSSEELEITFNAPTFTGGGSVTCRVVSKVSLVEVAW